MSFATTRAGTFDYSATFELFDQDSNGDITTDELHSTLIRYACRHRASSMRGPASSRWNVLGTVSQSGWKSRPTRAAVNSGRVRDNVACQFDRSLEAHLHTQITLHVLLVLPQSVIIVLSWFVHPTRPGRSLTPMTVSFARLLAVFH